MADFVDSATGFVMNPFGMGSTGFRRAGEILGTDTNSAVDKAQANLDSILAQANGVSGANRRIYDDYLSRMQGIYGDNAANYQAAVQKLAEAIGEGPETFGYDKTVNDFFDPYAEQAQAQAMDAINASASAGGNRFSSNYNDKLAAKQRALATEQWKTAYDTMMRDRAQQMSEWQAGQGAKQTYLGNLGTVAGLYGNDRDKLSDALGNYYSNIANQNNADLESYSDITQSKANLDAQRKSGVGSAFGSIGSVVGAIFS